jgi:hypothetical protein
MYRISSRGQPTGGGPPALGLGEVLTTHGKNLTVLRNWYMSPGFLSSWGPVSFWGRTLLHGVLKGCGELEDIIWHEYVNLGVLTTVTITVTVLWDVIPYSLSNNRMSFVSTSCVYSLFIVEKLPSFFYTDESNVSFRNVGIFSLPI